MNRRSRREFLADVGQGMLVATLGSAASLELGLSRALADDAARAADIRRARAARVAHAGDAARQAAAAAGRSKLQRRHRPQDARHRGGAGQRSRVRRPGLHGLPHVHGPGARLPDAGGAARRAPGAARAQGAVPQQQPHSGPGRPPPGHAAPGRRRRRRSTPAAAASRCATRSAPSIGTAPSPVSPPWRRAPSARRTITCNSRCRTKSTCIASCWPGGRGSCSTSPARSTPTRCCGSRSATA